MSRPQEEHTFYHSVKLDNPTKAIDRLIGKILRCGDIAVQRDLLPTMIDLQLPQNLIEKDLPMVRKLFHSFKAAQQRNFIRCITSLDLAANCDCADAFYTRVADHPQHVDAFCSVKNITGDYVELKVVVPFESRQNGMIRELSRQTDCIIDLEGDPNDTNELLSLMTQFCRNPHTNYILSRISGPCHLLLVTNFDRDEYIPIPVWGLSVEDAVRRFQLSHRNYSFLRQAHGDFVPHEDDHEEMIVALLQLIRDRLEDGIRTESALEIYNLAELVMGYFMVQVGTAVSNREIVMFDLFQDQEGEGLTSLRYTEHSKQ